MRIIAGADCGRRSLSPPAAAQSTAPRSLVVLVDVSASAEGPEFPSIVDVLDRGAFARLRPADRVRIGAIANALTMTEPLAADPAVVCAGARRVLNVPDEERYGASPLWDAVDAAAAALEAEPGRRGIILLTDGRATGNVKSLSAAVRHAVAAGVAVSIIDVGTTVVLREEGSLPVSLRPDAPLRALAELTGGKYVQASARPSPRRGTALPTIEAALTLAIDAIQ